MRKLVLLKLGGSLITDKSNPQTPRWNVLNRLANEIAMARQIDPELTLVLGHGSGSFGHVAGQKYDTRNGVRTPAQWLGFAEVWQTARALNQIVIDTLARVDLPVIAFPPSAAAIATDSVLQSWDIAPIQAALDAGLIPLVNGDVAFDTLLGGTIVSTEDVFFYLARQLHPQRILLSGIEPGVYADYPARQEFIEQIDAKSWSNTTSTITGSATTDVTGGMAEKVRIMVALAKDMPGLEIVVFSGLEPGNVQAALLGEELGTILTA